MNWNESLLLAWLGSAELPDRVALVHGEHEAVAALGESIGERFGVPVVDPSYADEVSV